MENRIWLQKYRIIRTLGKGGSSTVYLAEHIRLKTLRAIKQISKNNVLHDQLIREAYILKNLKHSCIPIIYDLEEDAHNSYIIEQYIEGESLTVYRQKCEHLSEHLIINIAVQICDLFNYLYSADNPILYLDLKPDNIMIADKVVKLIDFGASSYICQLKDRPYSLGTKGFAAPELYSSRLPDERTDVYGIGTLLYYMIMGKSYDIEVSNCCNGKKNKLPCSRRLQKIIERSLRISPLFRYPTVMVLKKDLLELIQKKALKSTLSGKSLCFAVAGTQHRIGTTHLALLLTSYFNYSGHKGIYIEKNNSAHISKIIKQYPNIKNVDGIYQLFNCNVLLTSPCQLYTGLPEEIMDYKIKVLDYGCLQEDNVEEFKKADIKLLVAGAKEWEVEATETALRLLKGIQEVKYLFNFTNGQQFQKAAKFMDKLPCYRIPYETNPFRWKKNHYLEDFVKKLISHPYYHDIAGE